MKPFVSRYSKHSPIVLTCEHASKTIPTKYKKLGLARRELMLCKDWNDPGALMLMRVLANELKASSLYHKFSRLVIDANRRLDNGHKPTNTYHAAALKQHLLVGFPEGERIISIPGNHCRQPRLEEKKRWKTYVDPYYREGCRFVRQAQQAHGRAVVVQVHSFYPTYNGSRRKVDIDVLHSYRTLIAHELIGYLRGTSSYVIGDNEPWGLDDTVGGGVFAPLQGKPHVTVIGFDVNNKNLRTLAQCRKVARVLSRALQEIVVKSNHAV